jgi:hypothetical protein
MTPEARGTPVEVGIPTVGLLEVVHVDWTDMIRGIATTGPT